MPASGIPEQTSSGRTLRSTLARGFRALAATIDERVRTGGASVSTLDAGAPGATYLFSYPAHVAFEVRSPGGGNLAWATAGIVVARLVEAVDPAVSIIGAMPAEPRLLNLRVWVGSRDDAHDELRLEDVE